MFEYLHLYMSSSQWCWNLNLEFFNIHSLHSLQFVCFVFLIQLQGCKSDQSEGVNDSCYNRSTSVCGCFLKENISYYKTFFFLVQLSNFFETAFIPRDVCVPLLTLLFKPPWPVVTVFLIIYLLITTLDQHNRMNIEQICVLKFHF